MFLVVAAPTRQVRDAARSRPPLAARRSSGVRRSHPCDDRSRPSGRVEACSIPRRSVRRGAGPSPAPCWTRRCATGDRGHLARRRRARRAGSSGSCGAPARCSGWRRCCWLHTSQLALWIASWVLIGRGALEGRTDWGWLTAWALLIATMVPLQVWTSWLQGALALSVGRSAEGTAPGRSPAARA